MMSYYFVVNYDITDQEMYKQYVQAVRPTLMQHGAKVLVVDHEPNDLEGNSAHTLVVLEFGSEEAAMKWYNSTEYQAIVNLRIDASEGWFRGAPQFVMPT
jgi:uncharacterized protein (DUF1330 family)